ncbi:hypothetical protein RJ639_023304 [Escallonia herrerae]|uniref:Cytochrome P450 n=1 Tax=Escallonia herrerae TaxID=1293975 RepID=A0AA89AF08_9ASTE|nr:hypothetical protein RJ639_023304 [Escallonia herrerae]
MEHILLLIIVAILTLLAILLFAHGSNRKWVAGRKQPLPPGSFGWPIIGESIQFISALKTGFGEEFITERAKKYSPHVFKTSVLGDKVVIFPGQAGNKFIFTNEKMLFDPYLPSSMRKLFPTLDFVNLGANKNINSLFKPDSVDKLVASIDSVSKHHLNKYWVGNKEVKAQNLLELYTITVACGAFMGMKDVDQISEFSHHFNILNKGLFTVPYKIPGTPFFRAAKAAEALGRQIGLIVAQKKADMSRKLDSPVQDILSQLLSDGEEPLTEMEMVDKILFFLVSGNVTTTSVITSTMKYLAEYPDLYNEVMKGKWPFGSLVPTFCRWPVGRPKDVTSVVVTLFLSLSCSFSFQALFCSWRIKKTT